MKRTRAPKNNSVAPTAGGFETIEQRLDSLEISTLALRSDLTSLKNDLVYLEGVVDDAKKKLAYLDDQVSNHEYEIEEAKDEAGEAKSMIECVESDLRTLSDKVDEIDSACSDVLLLKN